MRNPKAISSRWKAVRALAISLCAVAATGLDAHAGSKPHCRDLTFDGAAGEGSQDKVTLRIMDAYGVVIDTACLVQVEPNETHTHFASRLPGAWGDGTGALCPGTSTMEKKTCGTGTGGRSCKHKFIFKQKADGTIKKEILRICCYESPDCKGPRLGKTDASAVPITVQSKVDPAVTFSPTVPPAAGIVISQIALDPIGMVQLAQPAQQTCRKELGAAVRKIENVARSMIKCHDAQMRGLISGVDCNDPIDMDAKLGDKSLYDFVTGLVLAANTSCVQSGTPAAFGYNYCPYPCGSIPMSTWTDVADCLWCVSQNAVEQAMTSAYGVPPPGLSPTAQTCQNEIGKSLVHLLTTYVDDIVRCQRLVDAGQQALPEDEKHCKGADVWERRALAEEKIDALIEGKCSEDDVDELDTCDADVFGVVECVLYEGVAAAYAISDGVFPEGQAYYQP